MDYTPTTEEVRNGWSLWGVGTGVQFDTWLAEELRKAKVEAWEGGALWQRENAVPDDRRMKARFVSELQAVNPYRQGETE